VSFCRILGAVLMAGMVAAARGQTSVIDGDVNAFATYARNYNLVTLGNATLGGSSDTQGGIAVGGNLAINGAWTIASTYSDSPDPSLFLNGQLSLTSSTTYENNGYMSAKNLTGGWSFASKDLSEVVGGNTYNVYMNSSDPKASIDPRSNAGPTGWNWTTESSEFATISTSLSTQAQTTGASITVDSQNLDFTSTATSGVVVFDLDASKLSGNTYNGSSFGNIQINVPTGVDYVINVLHLADGQTLFGSGANFNSGTNDDQLLWNFVGTGSSNIGVTISDGGNFYGSILAPKVNLTDNTTIAGQVVAGSFTDNGVELHDLDFTSVVVPEAPTFALWAVGLCGAAVLAGRRLRRARS
jgi:choice-of-anchor A domain-containing protein